MTERVPYGVAAEAGRASLVRARRAGCTLEEHVVLEAIVSLTALAFRLSEDVAVGVIAERAGLHPKNASRALGRLRDLGVIEYTPGRGRGHVSRVGLPLVENGAEEAPFIASEKGSRISLVPSPQPDESSPKWELALVASPEPPTDTVPEVQDEVVPVAPSEHDSTPKEKSDPPAEKRVTREPRGGQVSDRDERVAREALEVFNERAGTGYRFEEWGGHVVERVLERPEWTLEDWRDVIRRAFAVAWWEKKLADGERPTPVVIFSSARQIDAALNVPDRMVEDAERRRAADAGIAALMLERLPDRVRS